MSDLDNLIEIWHIVFWIPNALQIHRLSLVINQFLKFFWGIVTLDEFGRDA